MGGGVQGLLGRLQDIGGRLRAVGGTLEYVGPLAPLTRELRRGIKTHKWELVRLLEPRPIASLVADLADCGLCYRLEDGVPRVQTDPDADPTTIADPILDEAQGRIDELAEFLSKTEGELTVEELDALGFRRRHPGARILVVGEDEKPGWVLPRNGGLASDPESEGSDLCDVQCHECRGWTSRRAAACYGGLCWHCHDTAAMRKRAEAGP